MGRLWLGKIQPAFPCEAPEAIPPRSTRATSTPRSASECAAQTPITPPPITSTSARRCMRGAGYRAGPGRRDRRSGSRGEDRGDAPVVPVDVDRLAQVGARGQHDVAERDLAGDERALTAAQHPDLAAVLRIRVIGDV